MQQFKIYKCKNNKKRDVSHVLVAQNTFKMISRYALYRNQDVEYLVCLYNTFVFAFFITKDTISVSHSCFYPDDSVQGL